MIRCDAYCGTQYALTCTLLSLMKAPLSVIQHQQFVLVLRRSMHPDKKHGGGAVMQLPLYITCTSSASSRLGSFAPHEPPMATCWTPFSTVQQEFKKTLEPADIVSVFGGRQFAPKSAGSASIPGGPVAPVAPVSPFGPVAPVAPVSPLSPCGPVAPRCTCITLRPLWSHWTLRSC